MGRARAAGVAALILAAITLAGATRADVTRRTVLHPDDAWTVRLGDVDAGTRLRVDVETGGRPVDVLVLPSDRYEAWRTGERLDDPGPGGGLAVVDHEAEASLPSGGWTVVVDNTGAPPGGAFSAEPVTVRADVRTQATPMPSAGPAEALASPGSHVPVTDGFGVAGWTVWALALAVVAVPKRVDSLAWIGVVAAATFPVTTVQLHAVVTHSLVPGLVASIAGVDALRRGRSWRDALRRAGPVALLGLFVGADLLHAALDPAEVPLVAGGGGVADALVVAPVVALVAVGSLALWSRLEGGVATGWDGTG